MSRATNSETIVGWGMFCPAKKKKKPRVRSQNARVICALLAFLDKGFLGVLAMFEDWAVRIQGTIFEWVSAVVW